MEYNINSLTQKIKTYPSQSLNSNQYFKAILQFNEQKMMQLYGSTSVFQNAPATQKNLYTSQTQQSVILISNSIENHKRNANMSTQQEDSSEVIHFIHEIKSPFKVESQAGSKNQEVKKLKKNTKITKKVKNDEDYVPDKDIAFEYSEPKISQSKNIPKIFGKKILNFITKNPDKVSKLLEENNCDEEEFLESVKHYQQHMGSIADLRDLWIGRSNKFAKIYRIFSKLYMRKHSLSSIFNSQITCLSKHLKYVKKISQSIDNPEHFTNMKDY